MQPTTRRIYGSSPATCVTFVELVHLCSSVHNILRFPFTELLFSFPSTKAKA